MSISHSPSVPVVWPLPAGLVVSAWLQIPPRFFGLLSGLLSGILSGFGCAPAPDVAGGRRSNSPPDHQSSLWSHPLQPLQSHLWGSLALPGFLDYSNGANSRLHCREGVEGNLGQDGTLVVL